MRNAHPVPVMPDTSTVEAIPSGYVALANAMRLAHDQALSPSANLVCDDCDVAWRQCVGDHCWVCGGRGRRVYFAVWMESQSRGIPEANVSYGLRHHGER